MYWIFLVIFIITILMPDIIHNGMFGMPQERIEELLIFSLGMIGFLFFILKEHQLESQRKEKLREQRRLQQTSSDLVDSYSYIGEVNRKIDILLKIGSNLSEEPITTKRREREVFESIIGVANSLLHGERASLVFYDMEKMRPAKEICSEGKCYLLQKNKSFFEMGEDIYMKIFENHIVFSSHRISYGIRAYLVVKNFDEFQAQDNNNQEIMKYLTVQALFIYSNLIHKK